MGYSTKGALMMVAVDGNEPTKEGLDLWDFADWLIELGFDSAVNLDGM